MIANTPPTFAPAVIRPRIPYANTDLGLTISGWSDPDGDGTAYEYQWRKNGAVIPGATGTVLAADSFIASDWISCTVVAWDGTDHGTTVTTSPVYIGDPDDPNRDSDGDGMIDTWESQYGLDPESDADADLDKDGDGLSNYEEHRRGTNPDSTDSDGDGMPDGYEAEHELDPTDPDDADDDADGDGVGNFDEYVDGSDPWGRPVPAGWSLISFVRECARPTSRLVIGPIWYWNAGVASYERLPAGHPMEPWFGYWFYLIAPCEVNVRTGTITPLPGRGEG